jgi:hypothetical protein
VRGKFLKRYAEFLSLFLIGAIISLVGERNLQSSLQFLIENMWIMTGIATVFLTMSFIVFGLMTYEAVKHLTYAEMTPKAKHTFDDLISTRSKEIMRRAITIAEERGSDIVTEDDVDAAIKQVEER